jgi:hypothetical protein
VPVKKSFLTQPCVYIHIDEFFGAIVKLRKRLLILSVRSVCLSVCLSVRLCVSPYASNNWAPIGRIFQEI